MSWDQMDYDLINTSNPDFILLDRENVLLYSKEDVLVKALDFGEVQKIHEFYRDAVKDSISGYHLVYEDEMGMAFIKNKLFD
ncbi:MAG: hypothetical protein JEZ06_21125 [Anaerolineaceae bacterium]|nr:hypothetical protein [Anaerolineaceae bacterium]